MAVARVEPPTGFAADKSNQFCGAVAVEHLVVFSPLEAEQLLVSDTHQHKMWGHDVRGVAPRGDRFSAAVAVGRQVVCSPGRASQLLLYDAEHDRCWGVDVSQYTKGYAFSAVVPVGHEAVCVPRDSDHLVVYNTEDGRTRGIDITRFAQGRGKFSAAVAVGSKVVLTPLHSDQVVVYNTEDDSTQGFDVTPWTRGSGKFIAAAAVAHQELVASRDFEANVVPKCRAYEHFSQIHLLSGEAQADPPPTCHWITDFRLSPEALDDHSADKYVSRMFDAFDLNRGVPAAARSTTTRAPASRGEVRDAAAPGVSGPRTAQGTPSGLPARWRL